MFRKLVSNLPFSPALIHDVGFYAKRLKNEEATRRLTVLFVALAVVMQSLVVFSPPEAVNASSEQDIIRGGVSNLDDFLLRYDHNEDDLKDILTTVGITRAEIAAAKKADIAPTSDTYILTRYGQFSSATDEASLSYQRSVGGVDTRYLSPLRKMTDQRAPLIGWNGNSATIGWFGIIKSNGSLATKGVPSSVSANSALTSTVTKSVHAVNLTQGSVNAANNLARPLDKIAYTLTATNSSQVSTTTAFDLHMLDAFEYSTLIDGGGSTLDAKSHSLSWPHIQLRPGETQERTFVIQLLSQVPTTPTGQSNPSSYDCIINVAFGDDLHVPVDCPAIKLTESIIGQLPTTGIFINIIFASFLVIVASYFYARTRQMKNEIRIIRHNINTGII